MFFVISGRGILRMGDAEREVAYGDTVYVTPGRPNCRTVSPMS